MSTTPYPSAGLPPAPPIYASTKEAPDVPHLICDFLKWVEQGKGFALCEPYKPKYDWYMPIAYHSRALVMEFLDGKP